MEQVSEIDFQWLTNRLIKDDNNPDGAETGTILKINNYIMFLKGLDSKQLEMLKHTVISAVDNELKDRNV